MKESRPVIEDNRDLADMHALRRMALLQELARDHGRKRAAAILGVDRKTLDAGLDEGTLSRRMRGALDRALRAGVGSSETERRGDDELEARVKDMAVRVEALGKDMSRGFEAVRRDVAALRVDLGGVERRVTQLESGGGAQGDADASSAAGEPRGRSPLRREFPDLVTLEPAGDDEEVFGAAWPLVSEWRKLKAAHPDEGKSLSWLRTEERFLAVELALLEQHGMTLPPETYPLQGFDRNGQTNWRRTALYDTRRAVRKRELLRWVRRVCTLGLWWK